MIESNALFRPIRVPDPDARERDSDVAVTVREVAVPKSEDDGFLRQKNFLLNLPDYVRRRVPASWAGALRGLPAFVCNDGASLDVTAARLLAASDHGVVFAPGSTLRTLARYGVSADFAVCVDANEHPEKCLAPDTDLARVVLTGCSPTTWREVVHQERVCFLSSRHPTSDWLATQGIEPTTVTVTENDGVTALELARFMGCTPIYLFGFDPKMPEGIWRSLDALLATWPANLVTNVSDRGSNLSNSTRVHPENFQVHQAPQGKRPALWHLPSTTISVTESGRAALQEIGALGASVAHAVASLRAKLNLYGHERIVAELRELFSNTNLSRILGSFSLKMMPHLEAPVHGSAEVWSTLLDELEELGCLAEAVYDAPGTD
jgi:hypothetical protein